MAGGLSREGIMEGGEFYWICTGIGKQLSLGNMKSLCAHGSTYG